MKEFGPGAVCAHSMLEDFEADSYLLMLTGIRPASGAKDVHRFRWMGKASLFRRPKYIPNSPHILQDQDHSTFLRKGSCDYAKRIRLERVVIH